jgi:hypothetical protein
MGSRLLPSWRSSIPCLRRANANVCPSRETCCLAVCPRGRGHCTRTYPPRSAKSGLYGTRRTCSLRPSSGFEPRSREVGLVVFVRPPRGSPLSPFSCPWRSSYSSPTAPSRRIRGLLRLRSPSGRCRPARPTSRALGSRRSEREGTLDRLLERGGSRGHRPRDPRATASSCIADLSVFSRPIPRVRRS